MAEPIRQRKDPLTLLSTAEARIDAATAQLLLAIKGVTDASKSQAVAVAELREASEAIKTLRKEIAGTPAEPLPTG